MRITRRHNDAEMDRISIPRCDEAKDFMRRMVGEKRGALAY